MGKGKPRRTKSAKCEVIGYVLFGLLFMGGVWTLLSISVWALLGLGLMAIPIGLWLYQKMKK